MQICRNPAVGIVDCCTNRMLFDECDKQFLCFASFSYYFLPEHFIACMHKASSNSPCKMCIMKKYAWYSIVLHQNKLFLHSAFTHKFFELPSSKCACVSVCVCIYISCSHLLIVRFGLFLYLIHSQTFWAFLYLKTFELVHPLGSAFSQLEFLQVRRWQSKGNLSAELLRAIAPERWEEGMVFRQKTRFCQCFFDWNMISTRGCVAVAGILYLQDNHILFLIQKKRHFWI